MNPDYYQILGVSPKATAAEIQKEYRALALQHHPDNGGDAGKFKEINRAYETLKNPEKRAAYDEGRSRRAGSGAGKPGGARTVSRPSPAATSVSGNPLQDIFGAMRGSVPGNAAASSRVTSKAGGPIVKITLTPREAIDGVMKTILVNGHKVRIHIVISR